MSARTEVSWEPICWDCSAVALPATGACPRCGAELRGTDQNGPSPGARPPRVTRSWRATDVATLATFSGWLHDASWDDEAMTLDDDGTLAIPFQQIVTTVERCGQEPRRTVARSTDGRLRSDEPTVDCRVVVRHVTAVSIAMEDRDAPRMFCCCEHDSAERRFIFGAVIGPELYVEVERLDLTVEITDQLAHYGRNSFLWPGAANWDAQTGHWS